MLQGAEVLSTMAMGMKEFKIIAKMVDSGMKLTKLQVSGLDLLWKLIQGIRTVNKTKRAQSLSDMKIQFNKQKRRMAKSRK